MGAWATGVFDNDDVSDWLHELKDAGDVRPVRAALDISGADDNLDAYQGVIALAAAEAVAAASGHPAAGLPEELSTWAARNRSSMSRSDVVAALTAVERVLAPGSELRDLWKDAAPDDWSRWTTDVHDLRTRLSFAIT